MYAPLILSLLLPLLPMTVLLNLATTWSLTTLFSHTILLQWLVLVMLVGSCSVSVLSSLTPQPPLVSRRIDTLLVLLKVKSLVTVLVHALFACCLSPLLSGADGELSVLSLYLSLSTSIYFIISLFLKHHYCYDVPDIKLNCMKLLSLNYKSWAKSSLYETFKILKFLVPAYLLFNTCITDLLSIVPGQPTIAPDITWTGPLLSFLCPSAVYTSVMSVFVTHFLLRFSVQAAKAIVNHDLKFVLVSPALVDPRPLLSSSLTSPDLITKYLAHHELVRRVQGSAVDRAEIFTLTGGHPVLWHDIYKSWKNLLTTLTDKLNQQSEPVAAPLSAPSAAPKTVIGRPMMSNAGPNSSFVSPTPATPAPIKTPVNQFAQTPAPRTPLYSVSTPAAVPEPKVYDVNQLTAAVQVIGSTAASTLQDWLYNKLLGTSIGKHFLVPLPELVFDSKFSDLALILRSTDAVSALCCSALTEDRYGVVQLVLPEILSSALLALKALDTIQPTSSKKRHHLSVRKSLQIMLYQLSTVYGDKLSEVKLREDTAVLLQQFK